MVYKVDERENKTNLKIFSKRPGNIEELKRDIVVSKMSDVSVDQGRDLSGVSNVEIPPNFKPTLPPRKRAKTQEEKEQRRIERILRNRKAAHHSREKKRLHLQLLEHKCHVMEQILSRIGNLEEAVGDDKEGRGLIKEYNSIAGDVSTPMDSESPEAVTREAEASADLNNDFEVHVRNVDTPVQQQSEDTDGLNAVYSSSTSSSSFSPNMALTPVSFVKEKQDSKNWDLLLTNGDNTYTAAPLSNSESLQQENNSFPQLWLPFDATEDNSFELDDWRNPAVITAITCN